MFISREDLVALTGRTRPRAQIAWLRAHGYRHDVTAGGRPVVARAEVERHLVGAERQDGWQGPRVDLAWPPRRPSAA